MYTFEASNHEGMEETRVWLNRNVNEPSKPFRLALNLTRFGIIEKGRQSLRLPYMPTVSENLSPSILYAFFVATSQMTRRMWNEMLKNYFRCEHNDMQLKISRRAWKRKSRKTRARRDGFDFISERYLARVFGKWRNSNISSPELYVSVSSLSDFVRK